MIINGIWLLKNWIVWRGHVGFWELTVDLLVTCSLMVYVIPSVDGAFHPNFHHLRRPLSLWEQVRNMMTVNKQEAENGNLFMGNLGTIHFILCQIYFAPKILCRSRLLCQRLIFKASLASLPLGSWEAPNNGFICDKVLRVDRPFLPLHKHRLKCVQLCMIPLQYFCLL